MITRYTTLTARVFCFLAALLLLAACHRNKSYKSDCDDSRAFKRVGFSQLLDSLSFYDKQYVEVSGKYKQGNGISALFNDSMFVDHSNNKALWVEFSPDCPLFLTGTRIGFFDYDYNNGKLTPANNKTVIIRGIINARFKGNLGAYKGSIGHISYVKL
jgi:hypothetical protein